MMPQNSLRLTYNNVIRWTEQIAPAASHPARAHVEINGKQKGDQGQA
jgi:hypothetical protein